jgi:hypothetical protein
MNCPTDMATTIILADGQPAVVAITLRSTYGQIRAYPDNALAKFLCSLKKRPILTQVDLQTMKSVGFQVEATSNGLNLAEVP